MTRWLVQLFKVPHFDTLTPLPPSIFLDALGSRTYTTNIKSLVELNIILDFIHKQNDLKKELPWSIED